MDIRTIVHGSAGLGDPPAAPNHLIRCRIYPSYYANSLKSIGRSSARGLPIMALRLMDTAKLMLECHDGRRIECVLMSEASRRTVCVSTQVGCGIGCVFCASGLKGVERNLERRRNS